MGNIIFEACPSCSHDAILVLLCPCLAELWQFKVMSADGPTSEGEVFYMEGSLFGARFRQPVLPRFHFELFPSKWMSFVSALPSIVALGAWYSTLGVAFPEFLLV